MNAEPNNFTYRFADMSDIDTLVSTRIEVLRAANKLSDATDMRLVERESKAYFERSLGDETCIAVLVFENGDFAACGSVSFYQVMPTYCNPTGKKAYIMNMYTRTAYRRKGIAYRTLNMLVHAALAKGISAISLEATEAGRPLYEKYGFVRMENEMELRSAE